ncbi:restriction endonuclease subunit S [Clostridium sp.]|uniref:restriction endonuclease subunit S n=1 Tax=Clostridium sp. TaxID=1506 RepID=UPI001A49B795|nr:restriction endonuclease subunit S [Clostridium sp.]MBK5242791.1 restriction endonuclease subunit S [Clostridium sp.]
MAIHKIDEVCELIKGNTPIQKAVCGKYPLVVTAENRLTNENYQFDCKAVCIPLVSSTGHGHASINRIHYQEGKFSLGSILVAVIPKNNNVLKVEYLYVYLSYMKDLILVPLMKGSANVSLTITALKSAEIEVPCLEEQERIIILAKDMKNNREILNTALEMQLNNIIELRQSILEETVQGKLVPQNPKDEPASVLLEKINEEKFKKIKKLKKEKQLPPIMEDEIPYELPKGWEWVRLGNIIYYKNGFAFSSTHMDKSKKGTPVIKSNTIGKKKVIFNAKTDYVSNITNKMQEYFISKGDLLMVLSSQSSNVEPLGVTAMYLFDNSALLNQRVLKFRGLILNNKYLLNVINSTWFHNVLSHKAAGSAQANLRIEHITEMLVPIPPLSEQIRIIQEIDKLMSLCDVLKKNVEQSKNDSELLVQSVLQEAFKCNDEIGVQVV